MEKKMWEIRSGQETQAMQYVVTMKDGRQVRIFVDAEEWSTISDFIKMIDCDKVDNICQFSFEDIKVLQKEVKTMKELRELISMNAKQFKEATVEEKLAVIEDRLNNYKFHKAWCEKYSYMDKRGWEYRQHKKFAVESRAKLEEWLNGIGVETLPETARF